MASVPDHVQNATRVALCVLISCVFGYGVVLPWGGTTPGARVIQYAQACKWSAITSVVIAQPVIGKLSQVGVERILGTIMGGTLGFAVFEAGRHIWDNTYSERDDGLVLSAAAGLIAFFGVWAGAKLKLEYSAKLFIMTFLLVTFGGTQSGSDLLIMVTRIAGICSGVLLSLITSVVVFPRSASQEAIKEVSKGLKALEELSSQVWSEGIRENLHNPEAQQPVAVAIDVNGGETVSLMAGMTSGHGSAEKANENEELCEQKLTNLYNALAKASDFVNQSKGEIFVGSVRNHAIFLPGLPWWPAGRWQLPTSDFQELAATMKALARLLFALHLAFDEGFDEDLLAMLRQQYPGALLPHLGAAAHGVLADAQGAFPARPFMSPFHLHRYQQAVEGLLAISDYQRRRVLQRLQPTAGRPLGRLHSRISRRRGMSPSVTSPTASERATRGMGSRVVSFSSSRAGGSGAAAAAQSTAAAAAAAVAGHDRSPAANGDAPEQAQRQSQARDVGKPPPAAPSTGAAAASSPPEAQPLQEHDSSRSPFEAFAGLPPGLHISVGSPPTAGSAPPQMHVQPPPGVQCSGGEGEQPQQPQDADAARTGPPRKCPSLAVQETSEEGLLQEALSIRLPRVPSSELLVFPNTAQGYVSQVRWHSFQFLVTEIGEELQELHACLSELLLKIPDDVFTSS